MGIIIGMAAVVAALFWGVIYSKIREQHRLLSLNPERAGLYLSQKGIPYRMHRMITPSEYMEIRILAGLIGAFAGVILGIRLELGWFILAVLGGYMIGYMAPDLYHVAENHEDNQKILKDMHAIYDTLRVYLAVDVFILDALDECYIRASNRRMKTAIYELKEGLKSQSEQLNEIEAFRRKFDNPHVNQLANLLSQYYRTGNVSAMLDDLSEQMVAIDHAIHMRMKEKMEWKSLIKEVMVLGGMLGGIAVALITSIGAMIGELF